MWTRLKPDNDANATGWNECIPWSGSLVISSGSLSVQSKSSNFLWGCPGGGEFASAKLGFGGKPYNKDDNFH